MARPALFTHRKFRRLCRILGSKATAVGSLELIWNCAYQDGDPRLGNSDDVESAADWRGEAGKLTSALVDAGFIDTREDGFSVHDLDDHAPGYVKRRMLAEQQRREQGVTISDQRRQAANTRWERARGMQTDASCMQTDATGVHDDATPAPAPAPAPAPSEVGLVSQENPSVEVGRGEQIPPSNGGTRSRARKKPSYTQNFERFWAATHVGSKAEAFAEWSKIDAEPNTDALIATYEHQAARKSQLRASGEFAEAFPHTCRWLSKRRWEDSPT